MKHAWILFLVTLILFGGISPVLAEDDDLLVSSDDLWLPEGDAKAGRTAFVSLKCVACHRVYNDSLPKPFAETEGPILGLLQIDYSPSEMIIEIVNPSHSIGNNLGGNDVNGKVSRMGDFMDSMTVRQLINISAYLQSLARMPHADAEDE